MPHFCCATAPFNSPAGVAAIASSRFSFRCWSFNGFRPVRRFPVSIRCGTLSSCSRPVCLIAALTAVASFLLTRLEEAPRSTPDPAFPAAGRRAVGRTDSVPAAQSHRDDAAPTCRQQSRSCSHHPGVPARLVLHQDGGGTGAGPLSDRGDVGRRAETEAPLAQRLSHRRRAGRPGKDRCRLCDARRADRQSGAGGAAARSRRPIPGTMSAGSAAARHRIADAARTADLRRFKAGADGTVAVAAGGNPGDRWTSI